MARTSSSKKKRKDEEDPNPEVTQRKRLKALAFSNNLLSEVPAKPHAPLTPSNTVVKHHGKDILKKSQRKNRLRFAWDFRRALGVDTRGLSWSPLPNFQPSKGASDPSCPNVGPPMLPALAVVLFAPTFLISVFPLVQESRLTPTLLCVSNLQQTCASCLGVRTALIA